MSATVSTTTTVRLAGQTSVMELMSLLEDLPPNATVSFRHVPGDPRDPSYTELSVSHPRDSSLGGGRRG